MCPEGPHVIERFFRGTLSPIESKAFEERLATDAEFRNAVKLEWHLYEFAGNEPGTGFAKFQASLIHKYSDIYNEEDMLRLKRLIEKVGRSLNE